jgi:hypothetical protein
MKRLHPGAVTVLDVVRELMLEGRHSRKTCARMGVSLPTADRWLEQIRKTIPGARKFKTGKTVWYEWEPTRLMLRKRAP